MEIRWEAKTLPLNKPSGELRTRSALSVSAGRGRRRVNADERRERRHRCRPGGQVSEGADGDVVECQMPSDWSSRQRPPCACDVYCISSAGFTVSLPPPRDGGEAEELLTRQTLPVQTFALFGRVGVDPRTLSNQTRAEALAHLPLLPRHPHPRPRSGGGKKIRRPVFLRPVFLSCLPAFRVS